MAPRSLSVLLVLSVAFACVVANAQPVVKKTEVSQTSPASGKEMFSTYCAVCHGKAGKGDGPAATALKKNPANLTELSARNGGKFPELKVFNTIRGDVETPAHGSKDMPIWGSLFSSLSRGNEGEVQMRVANLTKFVEGLQVAAK